MESRGRLTILGLRDQLVDELAHAREHAEQHLQTEIGSLRHEMNHRFDLVDDRFDEVDKRFDELKALIQKNGQRRKR